MHDYNDGDYAYLEELWESLDPDVQSESEDLWLDGSCEEAVMLIVNRSDLSEVEARNLLRKSFGPEE